MPARTDVLTWLALLALTLATFLLSFARLGPLQMPVALLIAATKGGLVALFFMRLAEQRATNRLAALVAVVLLATLVALSAADVATRRTSTPPLPVAPGPLQR